MLSVQLFLPLIVNSFYFHQIQKSLLPPVPPSAVNFIAILTNNFREVIVPSLSKAAQEAVLGNIDPDDMDLKNPQTNPVKIRKHILEAVYGKGYRC